MNGRQISPENGRLSLVMGGAEWALLLGLSVLWGASFLFVGIAVSELPSLTIVFCRVVLAAAVLWIFIFLFRAPAKISASIWWMFLCMGLINNVVPFGLIVWGQQSVGPGLAAILNATTPIFTVVVASMLLVDERMTAAKLTGVSVAFFGVVLIIGPDVLLGVGGDVWAQFAILGAAVSYAFAAAYGRRFAALQVDPVITAAGQVTASALVLLPVVIMFDAPLTLPMPSIETIGAIIGLAVISTAVAYVLYFELLKRAGATNVLLVTLLVPVSAILFGVLLLDEEMSLNQIGGMAVLTVGLAIVAGWISPLKCCGRPSAD